MELLVEVDLCCPHCGEHFRSTVDTSQGDHSTIEDCAVCCHPMQLEIRCEPGEIIAIDITTA